MKAACLSVLIGPGLALAGVASAGPLAPPPAIGSLIESAQYLPGSGFRFPRAAGAIVDWCAVWAEGCGWPGARQFCQSRGFDRAISWDIFQPGRTFVIGSQRYCEGSFCKGFRFVRCG